MEKPYLERLGVGYSTKIKEHKNKARTKKWEKQIKELGFDSRETWCLYSTMFELFFEKSAEMIDKENAYSLRNFNDLAMSGLLIIDKDIDSLIDHTYTSSNKEEDFILFFWKEWGSNFNLDDNHLKLSYELMRMLEPRLKFYYEEANEVVDLDYNLLEFEDETLTQKQGIFKLLDLLKTALEAENPNDSNNSSIVYTSKVWDLWLHIYPYLWW